MLGLQDLFHEEWDAAVDANNTQGKQEVCKIAVFILLGYCASLRGFKTPKIVLHKLRHRIQLED